MVRRDPTGAWSAPIAISASGARDPAVAMGPDGLAVVVWQRQPPGDAEQVEAVIATPDGDWSAVTVLSSPRVRAREPQVGVSAGGTVVAAWRRDLTGERAGIERVERSANGTWTAPELIDGSEGGARRPRLAVALDGSAAIAWEARRGGVDGDDGTVAVAVRDVDGRWSHAQVVSSAGSKAREPDVAAGRDATVVVAWIGKDAAGFGTFAAVRRAGAWTPPAELARGDDKPHEIARPGPLGPIVDTALLIDGSTAVAWTLDAGGDAAVAVAIGRDGTWGAPMRLSRAPSAGGAQVAPGPAGSLVVGWEEIDGGLLRVRTARVDGTVVTGCSDLDSVVTQSAAIRLGGGTVPVAVYLDLRRSTVMEGTP